MGTLSLRSLSNSTASIQRKGSSQKMIFGQSYLTEVKASAGRLGDIRPHSSWSITVVCAQDWLRDQSRAGAAAVTSAPTHTHTHIYTLSPSLSLTPSRLPPYHIVLPRALAKRTTGRLPLGRAWKQKRMNGGHRGFWADSGSNSSRARCMPVQMQVTHRALPSLSSHQRDWKRLVRAARWTLAPARPNDSL